jgi:type III secretory pathway component EscR
LPIIFSMFEFTKQEQDKVTEARLAFNQEKAAAEVKDKSKKLFGNFMKKKGSKTDGSFNSGGTNTN